MMSSEEDPDSMALLEDKALKTKTKRVRQRVDAGEPRNSYASIPNFSSRPQQNNSSTSSGLSPYHPNGYTNKMLCDLLGARIHSKDDPTSAMILDNETRSAVNGANAVALSAPNRLFLNGSCDLSSLYGPSRGGATDSPPTPDHNSSSSSNSSSSHLLRDILQQGRKQQQLGGDYNGSSPPGQHVLGPLLKGNSTSGGHGPETTAEGGEIPDGSRSRTPPEKGDLSEDSSAESKASCRMSELQDSAPAAAAPISPSPADGILIPPSPASSRSCSPPSTTPNATWQSPGANNANNSSSNALEVKRARVETIVSNMLQGPMRPHSGNAGLSEQSTPVNGCKKRKLYQPQQHETTSRPPVMNGGDDVYEEEEDGDDEDGPLPKRRNNELHTFRQQLRQMQQQLVAMQKQYLEMMDGDSTDDEMCPVPEASPRRNSSSTVPGHMNNNTPHRSCDEQQTPEHSDNEDRKPRIQDIKDSRIMMNQSKTFLDYDNASMYDDQRRHVMPDQHMDKMTNSSREDRTVMGDDTLKPTMQESRQSCIVRPPSYSEFQGSNLDYEWLAESLKAELSTSLSQVVDNVMSRCLQRKNMPKTSEQEASKETTLSQMLDRKSPRTKVIDRGTRVNGHGLSGLRTSPYPPDIATAPKPPFYFPLKPPTSAAAAAAATAAFLYGSPPQLPQLSMSQPYPSPVHSTPTPQSLSLDMPEQTEAMSLVVTPKKKRHKVTDTRLNPRQALGLRGGQETENHSPKYPTMLGSLPPSDPMPPSHLYTHHPPPPPLVPVSLPTTVAIPNPSLNQSDLFHGFPYDPHRMATHYGMEPPEEDSMQHTTPSSLHPLLTSHGHQRGSPDSMHYSHHLKQDSGDISDQGDNNSPVYEPGMALISFPPVHTSTLTPMHLRKAKLMFFYARYPSSAVLKMYFPDIKFNKNNTAQLVKWFSNFREFYYIQMEKYARQAMSEGIKTPEDIKVTLDSELLRVLNLHYNRNNHIEAPENFRYVVEQTLREFFKALVAGKDSEQSWKKSIYKIIARLDDNVPEYFKSPNFLETLE